MKAKKTEIIVLLVAFFVFPILSSAQSVFVGGNDESVYRIDVNTIKQRAGFVQAWIDRNDHEIDLQSTSSKILMRFKCDLEEYAIASTVVYSKPYFGGDVISSKSSASPLFEPIVPGSVGESFLNFTCGYLNKKPWVMAMVREAADANKAALAAAESADAAATAAAAAAAADKGSEEKKFDKP